MNNSVGLNFFRNVEISHLYQKATLSSEQYRNGHLPSSPTSVYQLRFRRSVIFAYRRPLTEQ